MDNMGKQIGKIERGTFFLSPEEFAKWLADNHGLSREIRVGFYKPKSKKMFKANKEGK